MDTANYPQMLNGNFVPDFKTFVQPDVTLSLQYVIYGI